MPIDRRAGLSPNRERSRRLVGTAALLPVARARLSFRCMGSIQITVLFECCLAKLAQRTILWQAVRKLAQYEHSPAVVVHTQFDSCCSSLSVSSRFILGLNCTELGLGRPLHLGAGRGCPEKIVAARVRPAAGPSGEKSSSLGPPRAAQGERERVSGRCSCARARGCVRVRADGVCFVSAFSPRSFFPLVEPRGRVHSCLPFVSSFFRIRAKW